MTSLSTVAATRSTGPAACREELHSWYSINRHNRAVQQYSTVQTPLRTLYDPHSAVSPPLSSPPESECNPRLLRRASDLTMNRPACEGRLAPAGLGAARPAGDLCPPVGGGAPGATAAGADLRGTAVAGARRFTADRLATTSASGIALPLSPSPLTARSKPLVLLRPAGAAAAAAAESEAAVLPARTSATAAAAMSCAAWSFDISRLLRLAAGAGSLVSCAPDWQRDSNTRGQRVAA